MIKGTKHAKPLSPDAELTCQLVDRHVEDSQIDKVAKFLAKAAYRKKCDYQHKITRSDQDTERLTVEAAFHDIELFEICKTPPFGRNLTLELVVVLVVAVSAVLP